MTNELTHHGIKGQKWGIRRFQNKDGTRTPAGKKRLSKEDLSKTKSLMDSSNNMVRELQNVERKTRPSSGKKKMDLSNMSDKELRDKINRANLERQYENLYGESTKVSKGRDYARAVLESAGTVLALGSSALGIALAIKELKG